ncbi:MAG: hypothetical protein ABIX01_10810 [Chitinophagaceae bacterium]
MRKIAPPLTVFLLLHFFTSNAQSDSIPVARTLTTLLKICKHVDFSDPKTTSVGTFYKAAPYIVYRGEGDKARRWKDFANYNNAEEKKGVDEVCYKINQTANQDSSYQFIKYFTEKESEGTWHVIIVAYTKKGKAKEAAFAFLKIRGRYALGDID